MVLPLLSESWGLPQRNGICLPFSQTRSPSRINPSAVTCAKSHCQSCTHCDSPTTSAQHTELRNDSCLLCRNPNEPQEPDLVHGVRQERNRFKNIEWTAYEAVHKKYLNLGQYYLKMCLSCKVIKFVLICQQELASAPEPLCQ